MEASGAKLIKSESKRSVVKKVAGVDNSILKVTSLMSGNSVADSQLEERYPYLGKPMDAVGTATGMSGESIEYLHGGPHRKTHESMMSRNSVTIQSKQDTKTNLLHPMD